MFFISMKQDWVIMPGVWLITEPTGISMYALFTLRIFMVVRVLFIPTYWLC
jgi:hypothetical protein